MALPLIPIALGGAAILILALTSSKASPGGASPGGGGASPGPVPPAPPGRSPNAMPAQLKAAYEDLLANGRDPAKMEEVAAELERYGFTNEGARLRARAAQLRAAQNVPVTPVGPAPGGGLPGLPNFPIPVTPPSAPGPTMTATVITESTPLNIRSAPDGAVLGSAPKGASVQVLNPAAAGPTSSAPSGWAQIRYNGVTGYASKQYLSGLGGGGGQLPVPVAPAPGGGGGPQTATVTTASTPLNIRSSPDTGGIVGSAPKGAKVVVLNYMAAGATANSSLGWAQISYGGITGYASKNYLQLDPTISGVVVGASGEVFRCAAPSGCYLRVAPDKGAASGAIVGRGERVRLLAHAPGRKAEAGSPGQGGWAKVAYGARVGWLPSEWLV